MSSSHTIDEQVTPAVEASAVPRERRRFRLFFVSIFLLPSLLYVAVFPCVMIPSLGYEHWGASKWGPVLDFAFHADHRDAEILVFGDSSAFLGLDPHQVDDALGTSTVILPNTVGSLPVTNDLSLRRYLQSNRPPRLIVFYFSAWNLDYRRTATAHFFEGEEMLLRNGSWPAIGAFARAHPMDLLAFPMQLNSTLGLRNIRATMHHPNREAEVADAGGHVDYTEPYPPVVAPCRIPEIYLRRTGAESVALLMHRYSTPETQVRIYLAPIPACENAQQISPEFAGGVRAEVPVPLPAPDFAQDGFYAHIRPEHVSDASAVFIRWLRRKEPDLSRVR